MRNATANQSQLVELPLFATDAEIAPRIAAGMTVDEWKAQAVILERQGLPKIDPIMRRRFWPAVKSFFERQYGVHEKQMTAPDGIEDLASWHQPRHPRRQALSVGRAKADRTA